MKLKMKLTRLRSKVINLGFSKMLYLDGDRHRDDDRPTNLDDLG